MTEVLGRSFKDLQDEVLAYGFDDTRYRARVKTWLNEQLSRIRRRVQLPQAEASLNFATEVGIETVELPTNFVRLISLRNTDVNEELSLVDQRAVDTSVTSSGRPCEFSIFGFQITLYPTPDKVYALKMRHVISGYQMVADADNPGLPDDYRYLLIAWALSKAYPSEDDGEMGTYHRQIFENELHIIKADLQDEEGNARVRQVPAMWSSSPGPTFVKP